MHDEATAPDGRMGSFVALNVSFDQLNLAGQGGNVLPAPRREVAETPHVISRAEKALDQMRADEARPAGDQDLLRVHASDGSRVRAASGVPSRSGSRTGLPLQPERGPSSVTSASHTPLVVKP